MADAGIIEAVLRAVDGRFKAAPAAHGETAHAATAAPQPDSPASASPQPAAQSEGFSVAGALGALRERRALQAEAAELLLDVVKMSASGLRRGQGSPVLMLCGEVKEDIVAAQALRKRFGHVRGERAASRHDCKLRRWFARVV